MHPGRVCAGLLVLAAVACDPTGVEEVGVALELPAAEVEAGSHMRITVVIHNERDEPVAIDDARTVWFEVRSPSGKRIFPTGQEPRAVSLDGPLLIEPDGTGTVVHRWVAIDGYGVRGGSGEPLPPGSYTVTPTLTLDGDRRTGTPVPLVIR